MNLNKQINTIDNIIYISLSLLLSTSLYLLNYVNGISKCSLAFAFLFLTTNTLFKLYSKLKAIFTLSICLIITLILSIVYYNTLNYYFITVSYISFLTSLYCSRIISFYFKSSLSCLNTNIHCFFDSLTASFLDSFFIFIIFTANQMAFQKSIIIFYKELIFKILYFCALYSFIFLFKKCIFLINNFDCLFNKYKLKI